MPRRMVRAADVVPYSKGEGRSSRVFVTKPLLGVTAFSQGINVTQPGKEGPVHVHEESSETMVVVEGKVKFNIGGEEYLCEADGVVHVPAGVPHGFVNVGDIPSKFVFIYAPPLPEHL